MARNANLGTQRTVTVHSGQIRYYDRGEGPPVVFVHGALVNADLWRNVVPAVADAGFRCIAPDWPLGGHSLPMSPQADQTPPGLAGLIGEVLDKLDLDDVTVVANDTGGAITQLAMVHHPERIGRVVLTPSDCFDHFLPPMFGFLSLSAVSRVPGAMRVLALAQRSALYRPLLRYLGLVKRPIPAEVADSYTATPARDRDIRRDTRKVLSAALPEYTLAAAERLGEFGKPVLLAWPPEEVVFPISLAHRLAAILPDARLVEIDDARTFVAEDQPARLAELVVAFAGAARQVKN